MLARSFAGLQNTFNVAAGLGSNRMMAALSLVYEKYGDPSAVLTARDFTLRSPSDDEVCIEMLAAPINPSDINTIQGKYPIQPPLPATPGNEGLGCVVSCGNQVHNLAVGDWAVPLEPGEGTWRAAGVFKAANWHRVPSSLNLADAATLCINPPTAVCLLENFVSLHPGDSVIQNGGTSAVGQAVIQLCKARGIHSINIIRDRPNWDETVAELKAMGATLVTTEERVKADIAAAELPAPALGLNCVGGTSGTAVAKQLRDGATYVTYGGMSLQPVILPTTLFIFKDITARGFWLSGRWARDQPGGKQALIDRVVQLIQAGQLSTRAKTVQLRDWQAALKMVAEGFIGQKVLLVP